MKIFKKKEEIPPLVWDREEEYKRAYARLVAAEEKLDEATAEGNEEKIKNTKAEWEELKTNFDILYTLKQAWLKETGSMPKVEQKDKMSVDTKVAAGVTILGVALPPLIENRGVILRGIKDWIQKPKLWRK